MGVGLQINQWDLIRVFSCGVFVFCSVRLVGILQAILTGAICYSPIHLKNESAFEYLWSIGWFEMVPTSFAAVLEAF